MILKKMIEINAVLHCETGLRIGGSKDTIEIGGVDNPIIRHPITELPYIPGSSLKGKLRSLLENVYGRSLVDKKSGKIVPSYRPEPCGCGGWNCLVCRVFGPHKNINHRLGPTRLIVRDAKLTEDSQSLLAEAKLEKGLLYSEVKIENMNNRTTGTAQHPRNIERVPEGTEFDLSMTLKVYDKDEEEKMKNFLLQGLNLLQNDYLGSSGSRGYGQVRFKNIQFIVHPVDEKLEKSPE